jgi:SAM-dependent methyltransferase
VSERPSAGSIDAFYRDLWSRERWSGSEPNSNEWDRWQAIERLLDKAMEIGSLEPDRATILDLGCGRGWLAYLLAAHGRVIGIDPLAASIEAACENFPGLTFRRATSADLVAEGHEPFDLIVSSEVIEHIPDEEKVLFFEDTRRLLRPGGFLLLTTPRGELWVNWSRRGVGQQPIEEWLTEAALDDHLRSAGFIVLMRDRAHPPKHPLAWEGHLLKWILNRKGIRRVPLAGLRSLLAYRASQYQVRLARRPLEQPPCSPG